MLNLHKEIFNILGKNWRRFMKIRRAKTGEIKKIIDLGNKAFTPVRYTGYDFKKSVPQLYASNIDYSSIHYVIEDDKGNFVSQAANLVRPLNINNNQTLFGNVGTVSTLPTCQKQGHMTMLMKKIEENDIKNNVCFSVLNGDRKRYNHFGYEKVGYVFKFHVTSRLINADSDLKIRKISKTSSDINKLYEIYLKNSKIVLRTKENFYISLKAKKCDIFSIWDKENIIGYFSYQAQENCIKEFYITDITKTEQSLSAMFSSLKLTYAHFIVNPLNVDYVNELSKFSEEIETFDEIQVKVYNLPQFITMLFELNKDIIRYENDCYAFNIDGESYKIKIKNNNIKIKKESAKNCKSFTRQEFVRWIMQPNYYNEKKLSFIFSLNYPDLI